MTFGDGRCHRDPRPLTTSTMTKQPLSPTTESFNPLGFDFATLKRHSIRRSRSELKCDQSQWHSPIRNGVDDGRTSDVGGSSVWDSRRSGVSRQQYGSSSRQVYRVDDPSSSSLASASRGMAGGNKPFRRHGFAAEIATATAATAAAPAMQRPSPTAPYSAPRRRGSTGSQTFGSTEGGGRGNAYGGSGSGDGGGGYGGGRQVDGGQWGLPSARGG
ncbi:unnamed protein product, partial [Phaeothamnion confervicola]